MSNAAKRGLIIFLAGLAILLAALVVGVVPFHPRPASDEVDKRAAQVEAQVVAWRRDIHQHPELGNREFRTSALVAAHLKQLGLEVRTGVGHTGVIGILHGGKPGSGPARDSRRTGSDPVQHEVGPRGC